MSRVNRWWPMYVGDFAVDTCHLTNELVGVYVKLLNAIWRADGAIRNDPKSLARLTGVAPAKWKATYAELSDKFVVVNGMLTATILQDELIKAHRNREKRQAAALARWDAERHANAMQVQCTSNANASVLQCPSPSPSPVESSTCKEGGVGGVVLPFAPGVPS